MKKNGRSRGGEISETLIEEEGERHETGKEENGFFACYLLASLCPRFKGHTYIGFTINPRRRIKQHNGEKRCGAWWTKSKRPWEMVLCIYGFPNNVSALQFEWAWQHPTESLAVREAALSFKSLSGIANKIKLAFTMLTLPAWQGQKLTVNFFSTKYKKHSAGCPGLPEHMKALICPMDELPCYEGSNQSLYENENQDEWDDDEVCDRIGNIQELTNATVLDSAVNQSSVQEICSEQLAESISLPINSMGETSLVFTGLNGTKETVEGRDSTEKWIEDSSSDLGSPTRRLLQMAADDQHQTSSCGFACSVEVIDVFTPSPDCRISSCTKKKRRNATSSCGFACSVEVIDVFTPSPDCRISSCTKKKRRNAIACPDIIDLTKSPFIV
ncbi:structure-specific endonuclease subunit slx1 [Malania oleifera]|uniref:structure-specific endonuclease subunit slx1 n=1 Tax=Malania oleifera TaxID=397392 RepID=UPI0025AECD4C|nr:structure-specific endonuclease subunit slx1 [Malania oleifera]